MAAAADKHATPMKALSAKGRLHMFTMALLGASSAVTSQDNDEGVTLSASTTGVFTLAYPALKRGFVRAHLLLVNGADDKLAEVTAMDIDAGTATITVWDISGGAATDPTATDYLVCEVIGDAH
jgi:hypothetical protein